ncbi:MAG: ABC transporter permease subunit [Chloroflexi bacterium]|nr:ABC transporter permease subunit [Chloroflexota bacterium]
MNKRAIRAIIIKDLRQVLANKMVWLPMIMVPLMINVLMPALLTLTPTLTGTADADLDDLSAMLAIVPAAVEPGLAELSGLQQWVLLSSSYMFAPMFLIVPMMVASIIGADSFVGEKERKTLEGLLYAPVSDGEIFMAKVLTGLIPTQVISIVTFVLYAIVVNAVGYHIMGGIFFPRPNWLPLILWVAPAVSVAGMGAIVLISSRAKTFMQAQQAAGVLVLPLVGLMVSQLAGLLFLGASTLWLVGAVIWVISLWMIWVGAKTFRRGKLLASI